MTERFRLDQEPLDSTPKHKPTLRLDDSLESTMPSQFGLQEEDLVKNQWIPFATTAVFLLLMALFVSFVGSVTTHVPDPTSTSPSTLTITASPNTVIPSTATNLPIPTIEASTRVPISLRVLSTTANVRAAPSLSAKVIGQIKKDSLATPLARSDDGRWFLVISSESGMTGWVANELFETISGDPKSLPTVAPFSP